MTKFHQIFVRMQIIPNFVLIARIWIKVGMTVEFVHLFIESVTKKVMAVTSNAMTLDTMYI